MILWSQTRKPPFLKMTLEIFANVLLLILGRPLSHTCFLSHICFQYLDYTKCRIDRTYYNTNPGSLGMGWVPEGGMQHLSQASWAFPLPLWVPMHQHRLTWALCQVPKPHFISDGNFHSQTLHPKTKFKTKLPTRDQNDLYLHLSHRSMWSYFKHDHLMDMPCMQELKLWLPSLTTTSL